MNNLLHFLTDLAINPQKQIAFATDPETLMQIAGLAEADQEVLKSGERDKIGAAFVNELTRLSRICLDPGPDPLPDPDPPPPSDSSSSPDSTPTEEN